MLTTFVIQIYTDQVIDFSHNIIYVGKNYQ